jgi:hypothetical protein
MLDQQGNFPEHNPNRVSNYQVGKLLQSGKRSNSFMVPINVGLDFTAIDVPRVNITDQLLAFEEANDLGVYIYRGRRRTTGTDGRSACRVYVALLLASTSWNAYCSYTRTTTCTCDTSSG